MLGDKKDILKYGYVLFLLLIGGLSFLIIKPYITAVLMSFILVYLFYPLFRFLNKMIKNRTITSFLLLCIIILLVLVPLIIFLSMFLDQSVAFYHRIKAIDLTSLSLIVSKYVGENVDLTLYFNEVLNKFITLTLQSTSNFLISLPQKIITIFIVLFISFYLFKDGKRFVERFKNAMPLSPSLKEHLIKTTDKLLYATIYGVIVAAIAQGIIGTIGFLIFKVESPLLWGVVLTLASLLPFIGSALVWLPIALFKLVGGDMFNGLGLLLYGALIISTIDNLIKPKIVSSRTDIHPVLVILGIFGGLKLFGFPGVIIGPIILTVLFACWETYINEIKI